MEDDVRRKDVISLAECIVEEVQTFLSTREMYEESFRWTDLIEIVAETLSDDLDERRESWPAPIVWSSERPTVAGLYLTRKAGSKDFWLLVVSKESLSSIHELPKVDTREFAGPIVVQEPLEAKP